MMPERRGTNGEAQPHRLDVLQVKALERHISCLFTFEKSILLAIRSLLLILKTPYINVETTSAFIFLTDD
jgi:hypothetical protein